LIGEALDALDALDVSYPSMNFTLRTTHTAFLAPRKASGALPSAS
jgi:hypothetical protein